MYILNRFIIHPKQYSNWDIKHTNDSGGDRFTDDDCVRGALWNSRGYWLDVILSG